MIGGKSYFSDPKGNIIAQASQDKEELLTADLDLSMIGEVRSLWQYYRDRNHSAYQDLVSEKY